MHMMADVWFKRKVMSIPFRFSSQWLLNGAAVLAVATVTLCAPVVAQNTPRRQAPSPSILAVLSTMCRSIDLIRSLNLTRRCQQRLQAASLLRAYCRILRCAMQKTRMNLLEQTWFCHAALPRLAGLVGAGVPVLVWAVGCAPRLIVPMVALTSRKQAICTYMEVQVGRD